MKVIDCRLRPPIGAYAKDSLFELISNGVSQPEKAFSIAAKSCAWRPYYISLFQKKVKKFPGPGGHFANKTKYTIICVSFII